MQASPAGSGRDGMTDALTELLKTGAQALIASAVEAELNFVPETGQFSY